MVRTILTPNSQTVTFDVPLDYVGKELEVIAFTKNEGLQREELTKKKVSFTILHSDIKEYKFNRDEANER